ncbi:MAG: bifunctional SulP family inorganic anion transporter/carbonic anhydrase [Methylococcales bacterium]
MKRHSGSQGHPAFFRLSGLGSDCGAAFVVFLVAVPLCLGIALVSGAPLVSGLIAGIVGAIVVGTLSGSAFGISGPAAGLAVIVFGAINDLGIQAFLLAIVLAGCLQVLMGICRAGVIGYYFPSAVISGMLSGIGIIIFLKQIPHALGYDLDYEGDLAFVQKDSYTTFSELWHMLAFIAPGAVIISITSLAILIVWERSRLKGSRIAQLVHGAVIAVPIGVGINLYFSFFAPDLALTGKHLVSIPISENPMDLFNHTEFPDFSQINNPQVYFTAVILAVVASVETLLSVDGIDKLDPNKRTTPANRELCAQGAGNICSGLLGGLPVTQVILRSSINIQAGAKTKAAAVIQGFLILGAVLLFARFLNRIPLASLAAVLLVVGYRLAAPGLFKQMYNTGKTQFIPFVVTVLGLVLTDLLTGITIGLLIALFFILLEHHKSAFILHTEHERKKTILHLLKNVSFLNKAEIADVLKKIPRNSELILDATQCTFLDYDVYELINNFKTEAVYKKIHFQLENFRGYGVLEPVKNRLPQTRADQQALSPADVLDILKEGNRRFVNNLKSNRNMLEQINESREDQFPMAIILSCIDSRTSSELIFDQGLGDIFSVRVAGNVINEDILGCMEYACKAAGSKLIVVLGHSNCGAVKGACADLRMGNLSRLLDKIKPAIEIIRSEYPANDPADPDFVQRVADRNVQVSREQIRNRSQILREMEAGGKIGIVGAMYHIESGNVEFIDDVLRHSV